jgi:hypothetical protein
MQIYIILPEYTKEIDKNAIFDIEYDSKAYEKTSSGLDADPISGLGPAGCKA